MQKFVLVLKESMCTRSCTHGNILTLQVCYNQVLFHLTAEEIFWIMDHLLDIILSLYFTFDKEYLLKKVQKDTSERNKTRL